MDITKVPDKRLVQDLIDEADRRGLFSHHMNCGGFQKDRRGAARRVGLLRRELERRLQQRSAKGATKR